MDFTHQSLVYVAKSFGLLYLVFLSIGILAYAFWPSLGKRFERAAQSIMEDEDGPVLSDRDRQDEGR